jgi:acyl carrier protein
VEKNRIMEHLIRMLHQKFGIDPATVSAGTRQQDLGIDSILLVDLMLDVEDALGFSFQSMALPPNPSIGDICDLIAQNMNA